MQIRLKAKLGIGGPALDPDLVESRVGRAPVSSLSGRRGNARRIVSGRRCCLWETDIESTRDSDALVQLLRATLRPLERLRRLADENEGWIFVEVVGYVDGDVSPNGDLGFHSPAYELSPTTIADSQRWVRRTASINTFIWRDGLTTIDLTTSAPTAGRRETVAASVTFVVLGGRSGRFGQLGVEGLAVGDAASEELGPFGHGRDGVGRFGEESPELGMVPAEVVRGAVTMFANTCSQTGYFLDELVKRELIEFCVGSRHATSLAPTSGRIGL